MATHKNPGCIMTTSRKSAKGAGVCSLVLVMLFAWACTTLGATEEDGIMLLSKMTKRPTHLLQHGIPIFVVNEEFLSKTVGDEIESDLAKCKVLVVERSGAKSASAFFNEPRYCEAVRTLLKRGGVLFLDYGTNMSSPQLIRFLKTIKAKNPGYASKQTLRSYPPILNQQGIALLGQAPNQLDTKSLLEYGAYGAWLHVPSGLSVLAKMNQPPKAAALLMQEEVLGKGRVFFCHVTKVWLKQSRSSHYAFQENLISNLVGKNIKKSGPGQPQSVVDTYRRAKPAANPLYLSQTKMVGWWNDAYKRRIPILIAEPIGKARRDAPVMITVGGEVANAKLVTHYGEEIVSQQISGTKGKTQLVFLTDLKPYEHRLLFVYTDGPASTPSAIRQGLKVDLTQSRASLRNDAIAVSLPRNEAAISSLRLVRGGLGNAVARWGDIDSGRAMQPQVKVKEWLPAEIIWQGPVQVTISHKAKGRPGEVLTTLFAGDNPYLVMTVKAPGKTFKMFSDWSPSGRADNFDIAYASQDGVKLISTRMQSGTDFGFRLENIAPFLSENWFALQAPGRETIGVCMDGSKLKKLYFDRRIIKGITTRITLDNKARQTHSFRIVLDKGSWKHVHKNYIEFTNPPVVQQGVSEIRSDINVSTPVPSRDHSRIIYLREKYMLPNLRFVGPEEARQKAKKLVTHALKWGANVLRMRMSGNANPTTIALWEEVRALSKKHGLATFGPFLPKNPHTKAERAQFDERERPCPVKHRDDYYLRMWRDSSATTAEHGGCEEVHLLDEYRFINMTDEAKALFKKRYGGELPPAFPARFKDQMYANSLLYRMNVINELNRDLAKVVRKSLPDTTVTSVVNLKGLNRLWRISDMEEQSRYLDMPGVDLYSAESYYRKILMFTRGAYDNKALVENCIGYSDIQGVRRQLQLSTVYGASMLNFGGSDTLLLSPQKMDDAVGPHFVWMKLSGMSQLLSQMKPIRYAALLRDRNFFIKSIKNMELPSDMKAFTLERGLHALADLNNLQTDMVFSRFFKPEALKGYKLLIVPDNKYLSKEFAKTIRGFAEDGNCVYVEGKSCDANSVMQKLCSNGTPVAKIAKASLFLTSIGKGKVIYTKSFLSERITSSIEARAALTALLRKHSGTPQAELATTAKSGIDHIVYTDGKRYLITIINTELFQGQKTQIKCDVPVAQPAAWVDMQTGARGDFTGNLDLHIPPDSSRYILIAPRAEVVLPEIKDVNQSDAGYAYKPEMAFLKRSKLEEKPLVKRASDGRPAIGVYVHPKMIDDNRPMAIGHRGIRDELMTGKKEFNVVALNSLAPEIVRQYDMIVVPNIRKTAPAAGWEKDLREYVVQGGRVLLVHHAVGFQKIKPCFPEVGRGVGYTQERTISITKDHPVTTGKGLGKEITALKTGDSFESNFPDYISLASGPSGQVLAQGLRTNGPPENVLVVGNINKGKVVLCGMSLGCIFAETKTGYEATSGLSDPERAILWNATHWLLQ
jgi:hypothetical protein